MAAQLVHFKGLYSGALREAGRGKRSEEQTQERLAVVERALEEKRRKFAQVGEAPCRPRRWADFSLF